jgi:phosphotransferase system  glucose/maltose/N-acetylglucosamine-specific IIC component
MIINTFVMFFFGYLLVTKDYTKNPKWMYYMDGIVFAVNFAFVFKYLTDMIGF